MERIAFDEGNDDKKYLVIYDIEVNKRRTKLAKMLESYGIRVQYSAFELMLNDVKYKKMLKELISIIDLTDNIRIYQLDREGMRFVYGDTEEKYCDLIII